MLGKPNGQALLRAFSDVPVNAALCSNYGHVRARNLTACLKLLAIDKVFAWDN